MSVNGDISDLFFNMDISHHKRHDKAGRFSGFDRGGLREMAVELISSLRRLGVNVELLPTPEQLVDDFEERV